MNWAISYRTIFHMRYTFMYIPYPIDQWWFVYTILPIMMLLAIKNHTNCSYIIKFNVVYLCKDKELIKHPYMLTWATHWQGAPPPASPLISNLGTQNLYTLRRKIALNYSMNTLISFLLILIRDNIHAENWVNGKFYIPRVEEEVNKCIRLVFITLTSW